MNSNVHVSDEVMNSIAYIAATSVEGVKSVVGSPKNLVTLNGKTLSANISLILNTSDNIDKVCGKVQEKVKESLEGMMGADVKNVEVRVENIVEG